MKTNTARKLRVIPSILLSAAMVLCGASSAVAFNSFQSSLTPLQFEIEKQVERLGSAEVEERREAVTRLASMHHPTASRAALPGLHDASAIVRATAAAAILSLPATESVGYLVSMLADKDEFVRREVAYALGRTHHQSATTALVERLNLDKKDSVRAAAAVALGELGDPSAVVTLATILSPTSAGAGKKAKPTKDLFLLRAAARALGQIGNSAAVPALIVALQDEKTPSDIRRESALALGLIGDPGALPALRAVAVASDPYLAQEALKAIRQIEHQTAMRHGN